MSGSRESGSDWSSADRHTSASWLAAFAEGALPADDMRAIAAHVAGCDECAARVAAYAEVDSLVRAAPAPMPPATLRAGLFARLDAETLRASGRQLEADREAPTREIEASAFPVIDTAPGVPSSPANPSRLPLPPIPFIAHWGGVVAAALIVALLASVLITLGQSRNGASTLSRPTATIQPQPTATVLPQPACAPNRLQANLPPRTLLNDLAMTSPGTGWAVGATADSVSNTPSYHSLILRLSDCEWEPFGASLPGATLASLAMVSLAEGWAAGAQGQKPLLFHYENGVWSAVTPPPTGDIIRFFIVRAGPTGEVWVAGLSPSEIAGRDGIVILRLSGGQWKRIETPFVEAYDIAPVGPDDAWIIGRKSPSANVSFEELAHVRGSSLVSEAPLDGAITLSHLRMLSPTDGWAMGDMYLGGGDTTDNPQVSRAITLHYDGAQWAEASTGASGAARVVGVLGQGTAWSYTTKGVPEFIISTQRQVAGQWRDVPWPFKDIQSFSRLTGVTPNQDDCWAIGFYLWPATGEITGKNYAWLLLRYANGAWHQYGHAT